MSIVLFISMQETLIVMLAVLLLFGAKRIPEIARGLGKGMNEFRKAADDIKKEIRDNTGDIADDIKDINNSIK